MENSKQPGYNFSSVDLLIYIWKKRTILIVVGLIAGIASIIISLLITPMFQSSVITELFRKPECSRIRGGGTGGTAAADPEFRTDPFADHPEI
jgi:LPS O-antigen subunit length determinant protein (WzzB/FepE family)